MREPIISVGIMFEPKIEFELLETFMLNGKEIIGRQMVQFDNNKVIWNNEYFDSLHFYPVNEGLFELKNVTIGINFHWERKENQRFKGGLKIIVENNKLTAINLVSVENYLMSVISSEMSATASLELLKAHAVISRSWLLAVHESTKNLYQKREIVNFLKTTEKESSSELKKHIIWYERDAHTNFDVCADDHCQRYQGITRANTKEAQKAIEETFGQVLMHDNTICDARFSKSCGGVFEEFHNCWDDIEYPYLKKQRDSKDSLELPDLTVESESEKWIRTSPDAFCNTTDKKILGQVLNNYDQETTDFYRWKVEYTQQELSKLIKKRSGIDYGEIIDLILVQRGTSSRLVQLKIVGTKHSQIIGKELEIRRTLSESHLYSSAFVIDKEYGENKHLPSKFILSGAGWGHGVGLCQIGAAVMGEKGYPYNEILKHYYIGADIKKLY